MTYPGFGKEFVALSAESKAELPPDEGARELFRRFEVELEGFGLSLADTVRTRLWGRDREARDKGSGERVKILSGPARSASSSYICPSHFDSGGTVAIDLWAMRGAGAKRVREYEPPIVPPRYVVLDGVVFLSGVTSEVGSLSQQLGSILPRIEGSLSDSGVSWDKVVRISCFVHRSEKLQDLREGMLRVLGTKVGKLLGGEASADVEYGFVDGYSTPGKLVEIETTAVL